MATKRRSDSDSAVPSALPVSAAIGAAAYVLNYVLVYAFMLVDGVESGGEIPRWKVAGWVFYNAHNVDVEAAVGGRTASGNYLESAAAGGLTDAISALTSIVPKLVYYVVPAVVLVLAGVLAARRVRADLSGLEAAGVGAGIVGGYLVLAVVGVFAFEYSVSALGTSASLAPKLSAAVLLAGLVYPVVLGAVGGVLDSI
ncbi:transporter [Salarchaeum sp. JOR-1]|uniref:transporter n=1 Tax=Salarchaeum sp. JOR-1 TaxID=2599399 RepID=UPI00143DA021|nr:transporter [Salarchaeum sp. JOR-1]